MRTLTFALIAFGIAQVASAFVLAGGLRLALDAIGFAAFIPFALTLGCGVTNNKAVLIATVVLLLLAIYPCDLQHLAHAVAPVGIGLLVGTGLRLTLKQEVSDAS